MIRPLALLSLLLLAACSAQPATIGTDSSVSSPPAVAIAPPSPPLGAPSTSTPAIRWIPPKQYAGWTSKDRPAGSNCYGVMPAQCGADQAIASIGQSATPGLRARIEAMAKGSARFIRPGEAVTDDFRPERLNVMLDPRGAIQEMDCY